MRRVEEVVKVPLRFARTTCACEPCVEPCKRQPGPLAPGDFDRIVKFLALDPVIARAFFWASPGALLRSTTTGEHWQIGTVTPRFEGGRCVFLMPDDRCAIHSVAPFGCAYADSHQVDAEWQPKALWLYEAIVRDADYGHLRASLVPASTWNPTILAFAIQKEQR